MGQPGQPVDLHGAQELRRDPAAPAPTDVDARTAAGRRAAFTTVGDLLARSRFKAASARRCGWRGWPTSTSPNPSRGSSKRRPGAAGAPCCTPRCRSSTTRRPCSRHSCRIPRSRCSRRWAAGGLGRAAGDPRGHRFRRRRRGRRGAGVVDYPVLTGDYAPSRPPGAAAASRSAGRWPSRPRCSPSWTPKLGETGPAAGRRSPMQPGTPRVDRRRMTGQPHPAVAERPMVPPPEPLPAPVVDAHTHLDACGCARRGRRRGGDGQGGGGRRPPGGHRRRRPGLRPLGGAGRRDRHPDLYAAVALHPTRADTAGRDARAARSSSWPPSPRVVAIGETGLDHYWDAAPHAVRPRRSPGTSTWPSGWASR